MLQGGGGTNSSAAFLREVFSQEQRRILSSPKSPRRSPIKSPRKAHKLAPFELPNHGIGHGINCSKISPEKQRPSEPEHGVQGPYGRKVFTRAFYGRLHKYHRR
eukprot:TRINITY_DN6313_c0_g1_i1.p1 TRINITY_DN6313_c0_g1~~TRINITY_DN6313_c0_g1_i1.p1  ORF type:complete len:112 (+),score=4.24 TRINITY_DN6313_c0_g1_i1:26-337(+)